MQTLSYRPEALRLLPISPGPGARGSNIVTLVQASGLSCQVATVFRVKSDISAPTQPRFYWPSQRQAKHKDCPAFRGLLGHLAGGQVLQTDTCIFMHCGMF